VNRRTGAQLAILLLAALGALPSATQARDQGPPVQWLAFGDIGATLELQYEAEERDLRSKEGGTIVFFRDERFHEILTLDTRGYVYHPRFLDFRASIGVELEQADVTVNQPDGNSRTNDHFTSPQYSISGVFFRDHPVSLSFGAERYHRTDTRNFGDLYTLDAENQRATLSFKGDTMPAEVFFEHSKRDERQSGLGESRITDETRYGFGITRFDGPSTSHAQYEHHDNLEDVLTPNTFTPEYTFERHVDTVTLDNNLRFGSERRSFLDSRFSHSDETGSFTSTRTSLGEGLHLQHFKELWSDYGIAWSRDTFAQNTSSSVVGRAALSHQLFESLLSRLSFRGEQWRFEQSQRDRYGADLDFNYRKKIPRGMLFLDFGGGQDFTTERGSGTQRQVFDESHVLADLSTTFLDNPDVVDGSVLVTAANNITVYILGVDYELVPAGRLTQIRRIVTGTIPDGATVLVDYAYAISGPMKYTTRRWHGGVRLDLFDHLLALYARRYSSTNTVTSGVDDGRLEDLVDTFYGATLTLGPVLVTAEHNIHDSTLVPYVSDYVTINYRKTFAEAHTVTAAASWRRAVFSGDIVVDGRDTSTTRTLSGSYLFARPLWPSFEVTAGIEDQDDRGTLTKRSFARLEAKHKFRATEFALTLWLKHRESNTTLEDGSYVFFSVKRKF